MATGNNKNRSFLWTLGGFFLLGAISLLLYLSYKRNVSTDSDSNTNQRQTGDRSIASNKVQNGPQNNVQEVTQKTAQPPQPSQATTSPSAPQGNQNQYPSSSPENSFPQIKSKAEFISTYGDVWSYTMNDSGSIKNIAQKPPFHRNDKDNSINKIPSIGSKNVEDFSESLLPLFGAQGSKVSLTDTQQTMLMEIFHLNQKINGVEVYQGSISVTKDNQTGLLYSIDNRLNPTSDFSMEILFTKETAMKFLKEHYSDSSSNLQDVQFKRGPVVFSQNSEISTTQLAWIFHVRLRTKKGFSVKETIVSAQNKLSILYQTNIVLH